MRLRLDFIINVRPVAASCRVGKKKKKKKKHRGEFTSTYAFFNVDILKPVAFSVATAHQVRMAAEADDSEQSSSISSATFYSTRGEPWIYMAIYELCEHGDLGSYLVKNPHKARDMSFLRPFFTKLVDAVSHMHDRDYVHCDIKPENILVTSDLEPRLADFGMSQKFSDRMIAQGTPSFLAPEVVEAWFTPRDPHRFSDKIDIFSLGVMALNIASGKYPFRRITRRLRKGKKFTEAEMNEIFVPSERCWSSLQSLSPEFSEIVRLCLDKTPDIRPSAQDLLKMVREV